MALSEGREGPFEAFVRAETRRFLGYFRRLGAGRSEAEDLVQTCFKKLYELGRIDHAAPNGLVSAGGGAVERPRYRAQGQFRGFAFRMARNVWIDHARRQANARTIPAGADAEEILARAEDHGLEAPLAALERDDEAGRIRAAVAKLSDAHRAVFELGVLQELPYSEIAAVLDIPAGTVKSRMFHAVKKVRSALGLPDGAVERSQGGAKA